MWIIINQMKSLVLLVLLVLYTVAVAADTINWSTLTAEQLSQLTLNQISSASSTDIHSIPAASCVGFQFTQIQSLSSPTSTVCSGFTGQCIHNILPTVFTAFASGCVSKWTIDTASYLTADQLSNMPANAAAGFNKQWIGNLNSSACAGFNNGLLANIQDIYAACNSAGFTKECIVNIPAFAFSGFTGTALGCLSSTALSLATSSQLQKLNPNSAAGLTALQISSLDAIQDPPQCSGFTAQFLANLYNMYGQNACSGFTANCLGSISDTSGFTSSCIKFFPPIVLKNINKQWMAGIKASEFGGWMSNQITVLPDDACSGLTDTQVSLLYNQYGVNACEGFTASCLNNIPPNTYSGFASNCIKFIPSQSFSGVTSDQINKIQPAQVAGISSGQIKQLHQVCSGFTSDQLKNLYNQYGVNACDGFNADCISSISVSAIAGFQDNCVRFLPAQSLSMISSAQLAAFNLQAVGQLTPGQISNLPSVSCSGFSSDQIQALKNQYGVNSCEGFTAGCMNNIVPTNCAGFQSSCTRYLPTVSMDGITSSQLTYFTQDAISGFIVEHFIRLINRQDIDFVNTVTVEQIMRVNNDVILQLKSAFTGNKIVVQSKNLKQSEMAKVSWLQIAASTVESSQSAITAYTYINAQVDYVPISPFPSLSTSLIISTNSISEGFCPKDFITIPNSVVVIVPSPSLSNNANAS
jgi:hypothetical protein